MKRLWRYAGTLTTAATLWLAVTAPTYALPVPVESQRQQQLRQDELMSFGVYYYPEQWPAAQWPRDFAGMAALGFQFTHMAEFAWSMLEPTEGRFDFRWLDEAIAEADRAGLKVILGTPSAAPPAWMDEHYPEVYRVDEHGQRHQHGIRAEVSLANARYQRFVARVVAEMARRYGHDPRVWGWQIDNEPGSFPDYSAAAEQDFRAWLSRRYGSVDALNEAWGGAFWSSNYASFRQVHLPNAVLAAEDKLSPESLVDLARFRADQTADFVAVQAGIIRRVADTRQWITTNYTNVSEATDPSRAHGLDYPSFTLYPVQGSNLLGEGSYAIGKPANLMEAAAYYGGTRGIFGIMELQPGQVNWGEVNPQPKAGAIRLWLWHAYAAGASFVSTYRYRHPLKGSEMYHEGIVGTDGVTPSRTGREYVAAAAEIRQHEASTDRHATRPASLDARATAVLWSHDNFWDLEASPQTKLWHSWAIRNGYTLAIKTTGAPLTFVGESDDWSAYPFLVAPAYQRVSPALAARWRQYVEAGGHLILTARSGQKDEHGHFHEGPWAAPILDLIGADVEEFDMLPESAVATVQSASGLHPWRRWGDILVPRPGTETLALYVDGGHDGRAAAVRRSLGRGSVTMIGVSTEDGVLEQELLRSAYTEAGVAIEQLPIGVFLEWRAGYYYLLNYRPDAVSLSHITAAPVDRRDPLPAAGVTYWKAPP